MRGVEVKCDESYIYMYGEEHFAHDNEAVCYFWRL